ncbi:MAG: lipoyl synthase [Candidatus Omnitrophota bacterium]|nr:lipoyl synthase [Candidatus Omnitrophota bacterium]
MKNRLPFWFRQEIPGRQATEMLRLLSEFGVHTVCSHAHCPNLSYCFKNKKVTFMILGSLCSRNCGFCAVNKAGQKKLTLDEAEPDRVARVVKMLGLGYVVITSVTRDDLADKGARLFARTIEAIRRINKNIKIEVLIPDFQGDSVGLKRVLDALPDILAHNIETVRRLYLTLRPQADYQRSLGILRLAKELKAEIPTKSSIMLGLGETRDELIAAMRQLRQNRCDYLTLGQYLAPSEDHYPVKRFIGIAEFREYRQIGLGLGFRSVLSGPRVRSSYQAEEVYRCTT